MREQIPRLIVPPTADALQKMSGPAAIPAEFIELTNVATANEAVLMRGEGCRLAVAGCWLPAVHRSALRSAGCQPAGPPAASRHPRMQVPNSVPSNRSPAPSTPSREQGSAAIPTAGAAASRRRRCPVTAHGRGHLRLPRDLPPFRYSLGTHLLKRGHDIRTVQELLDHRDVATTMIYTPVLRYGARGVRSPLDPI